MIDVELRLGRQSPEAMRPHIGNRTDSEVLRLGWRSLAEIASPNFSRRKAIGAAET